MRPPLALAMIWAAFQRAWDAISRRLARLSDGCNRVLGLAAVIGREFNLPALGALADMPEEQLFDVLDEALGARLVHDVPGAPDRYAFTRTRA